MYQDLQAFLKKAAAVRCYARHLKHKGDRATQEERAWLNTAYCLLREAWDDVTTEASMPDRFWNLA